MFETESTKQISMEVVAKASTWFAICLYIFIAFCMGLLFSILIFPNSIKCALMMLTIQNFLRYDPYREIRDFIFLICGFSSCLVIIAKDIPLLSDKGYS